MIEKEQVMGNDRPFMGFLEGVMIVYWINKNL
jgi:hypothetical protein